MMKLISMALVLLAAAPLAEAQTVVGPYGGTVTRSVEPRTVVGPYGGTASVPSVTRRAVTPNGTTATTARTCGVYRCGATRTVTSPAGTSVTRRAVSRRTPYRYGGPVVTRSVTGPRGNTAVVRRRW